MPASTRALYRPRRGRIKPRGTPQIIQRLKPRGLIFCLPMTDPGFRDLTGTFPAPVVSGTNKIQSAANGYGLLLDGSTQCLAYAYNAQPPSTWSMEVIETSINPVAQGTLCGWNQGSNGQNVTLDRLLGSNPVGGAGNNDWLVDIFDGASKTAVGGAWTAGKRQHLIAVCDGATLKLYVDGALAQSTGVSNGGYTGYSLPVYFCVGTSENGGGPSSNAASFNTANLQLVNFANVAWTATEVQGRYLNPFGFLQWPEDRRDYLVGAAAVATYTPYNPWPLAMPILSQ